MIEVEIKASVDDHSRIADNLTSLGFKKNKTVIETDIYFNGNNRDFRHTDEALRLRSAKNAEDGTELSFITYKGSKLDNISQTRKEYEVPIEKSDIMYDIFSLLGYQPMISVSKTRQYYSRNGIAACLDKVEGLGSFIELEILEKTENSFGDSVSKLLSLLSELGVPETALTRKSYLELLLEKASEAKN